MSQSNAQTIDAQLEVVKKDIPTAFERDSTLYSMIEKRTDEEDVGSRGLFAPNEVRPGGRARQFSSDNGDIGRGGASTYVRSTATPIDLAFVIEISKKTEISTNGNKKAVANIVNRETANGMKQFRTFLDILSQGPGSGVLGTVANVASLVVTISGSQGTSWFYAGQGVEFYTANMATKRTGTGIITAIDPVASTITLDALPTGTIATDVAVIEGLTAGAGLNQTLYGMAAQVSSATSGTKQGINLANYPEFRSVEFPAGSTNLDFSYLRILLNSMAQRMGVDFAKGTGLTWWGHIQQKHAFENLAQQLMLANDLPANTSKSADIGYWNVPSMIGVKAEWGIHADPTVLYALNFKSFTRAVSQPIDYYSPTKSGQTRFPLYGSSGGLQATTWWALWTSFQILCSNPRANAKVTGLLPPTGYSSVI